MGEEELEAALLFFFVGFLVRIEFLDDGGFTGIRGGGEGGIFEDEGDAVVPAGVFGHVVGGRFDFDGKDAAGLNEFLKDGVMVLEEEIEEFFLIAPFDLVVVLHDAGFVGGALGWSALAKDRRGGEKQ